MVATIGQIDATTRDAEVRPRGGIIQAARRRLWIVLLCAVLGGVGAYLVSHSLRKQYTAVASLLFQQSQFSQDLFGFSASVVQDPATQQATDISLSSEPVISLLTARTVGRTYHDVQSSIAVSAANEGNVINIAATSSSPEFAAKLANAYADAVIQYQEAAQRAQVQRAAGSLKHQISGLSPGSPQASTLSKRLTQLEALASLQTGNVQRAGQALVPAVPSSPSVSRDTALGVLLGLIVGFLGALGLERRDVTLAGIDEVGAVLPRLAVLGELPVVPQGRQEAIDGEFGEAFRLLRAQLRYFSVDGQLRSLLVTSAGPGDGKSTVAWNLAVTYALMAPDSSVLLIDSDLRRPRLNQMGDLRVGPGLCSVLSDHVGLIDAVQSYTIRDGSTATLDVLTAGGTPPNPSQLLESAAFASLLVEAQRAYDLVVIDTSPVPIVSDAIPILGQVSGVLVVVRLRHTHRDGVRTLGEMLDQLDAPVLGVAINGVPRTPRGYYRGYESAGYQGAVAGPGAAQGNGASRSGVVAQAGLGPSAPER